MSVTMPDPADPQPHTDPVRTPATTSTTVDTAVGTITVQAGTEQYRTQDHGLTSPRAVVAFTIGEKTFQVAGAEAETFGRAMMFAAAKATDMSEEAENA